jgi:hypothetical protein
MTRAWPIRFSERLPALALAACVVLASAGAARAHGEADGGGDRGDGQPTPGWDLTLVARHLEARQALPSQALRGFLLLGDAGTDLRRSPLEHASLSLTAQAIDGWLLHAEASRHGPDPQHVEVAWASRAFGAGGGPGGGAVPGRLALGRQMPAHGAVWTTAGHVDRFSLMPLAKQAATGGDAPDDGVSLSWSPAFDTPLGIWVQQLNAGVWQGHVFPGSRLNDGSPSLHWGHTLDQATGRWQLDVFAQRWQVTNRGARLHLNNPGHSHVAPLCDASLANVLCFSGRAVVSGGSLSWSGPEQSTLAPLRLSAGWMQRQEDGELLSRNGQVRLDSRQAGHLLQAWWAGPVMEAGWRSERLMARHRLSGAGASAVSADAGFEGYAPLSRHTLALAWPVPAGWLAWAQRGPVGDADARLSVETGRESQGAQAVRFTTLRLVVSTSGLL